MVIWINGLSCAGKTTIGKALYKAWKPIDNALVLLDGDELRSLLFDVQDHSRETRVKLGFVYRNLCKMLAEQGINVILCCVGLQKELSEWNYANIPGYREIVVTAPMEILRQRDQKGVYRADTSNVMGVDIEPEYPENPLMKIMNDGTRTVEDIADSILSRILS